MPTTSMRSVLARSVWLDAALLAAAMLTTATATASGLWSQVSESDRQAVLAETRTEIAVMLRSSERSLLPRGPDGEIDRGFYDLVSNLADPDSTSLSTYAGEIAAAKYDRAVHSAISAGASKLATSFRRAALERLPDGSATRVYLDYLAEKGDLWREIARMAIDDRYSWGEVAEATWTRLNAAAADDISSMTESALTNLLSEAIGSWATIGYVAFLKAQVAYTGELEKLAVTISAGNYYDQYRSLRDAGRAPAAAWDELTPYLLGEGGLPSVLSGLRTGSARGFRAGGFLERHVTLDRLRSEFERCYPGADRCLVRAEALYDVDRAGKEAELTRRQKKTQAELRAELAASGGVTRAELRSVYAHVGDILRRKLREHHQLGDDQQQELARARNDIEALLARLRQLHGAIRGAFAEAPELATSLDASRGEADALFARAEDIGRLGFECRQAEGATSSDGVSVIAAAVDAAIQDADRASNRACDYDDPTRRAEAVALRDKVLGEWNRTRAAAAAGRAALARLAGQLAEKSITISEGQARDQLEALVDALEASRVFVSARTIADRLAALGGRTAGQAEVAREWLREIEQLATPWRGAPDIDEALDEARRLLGEGHDSERADSIGTMVAVIANAAQRGAQQARWFELSLPSFEAAKSKATAALSACAAASTAPGGLRDLLLNADSRLDASTTAADLCLARSQLLLERFDQADDDGGWQPATREPSPAGDNDGWQAGSVVPSCVTPAPAQAAIDGAIASMHGALTQPDDYAQLLAAIDALTAAASDPTVCDDDRGRIRDALQLVRDAQSLQLEQAREQTGRVHARTREQRARSAAAWQSAASALTGLLRSRNQGDPISTTSTGATGGTGGSGSTTSGADTGQAAGQCDAIRAELQRKVVAWQSLLQRRGSLDDDSFCRQAVAWQRDFTSTLQRAEASGCVTVSGNNPRAVLEQSRSSLAAFSCDSND